MGDVKCMLINQFSENDESDSVPIIEQYVQDVRDFSSQYGSDISISYTAYNITGKPSKFPDYGDFPQAFVMRTYGRWWDQAPSSSNIITLKNYSDIMSQDYIDVMFEHKVVPLRVNIYETYNPGSVVRMWAGNGKGEWALLWEGPPQPPQHSPLIFSPRVNTINFLTNMLRLEFDHSNLEYYTELDAILLTGYNALSVEPSMSMSLAGLDAECHILLESCASSLGNRRCFSPEEDKSPPGRSQSPHSQITKQVLDLELTSWNSPDDIKTSLIDLNNLAQHYITLLDDINKGIESVSLQSENLFRSLPDETVLKIFNFLDLKSLCMCSRVNRDFHRLSSDVMLYTHLGLRPYWNRVNSSMLKHLTPKCVFLQKLDLSWCGNYGSITPTDFVIFIKECGKLLTHLRLDCCKYIDDSCMIAVAQTSCNLKELGLKNCNEITSDGYHSLSVITTFERLDLYRTYIENEPLVAILKSSPNLKHIVLGSCIKISVMDEIAQVLGTYNKGLISADFWKTYSLTPVGVKALCLCKKLEEIDLGWCLGVSIPGDCLSLLASNCRRLSKVFMAALRGISDKDVAQFIVCCPALEQLDLLGVRNISANICYRVLRECKHLRLLDISFCDQIPDSLTDAWMKQFPRVSIKRSFQRDQPSPPARIHLHPSSAAAFA